MNENDSKILEVSESVRNNPRTLLIVSRDGRLVDFIPLQELPKSPEQLSSLVRSKIKGPCTAGIIHQDKNITEETIRKKISDCVECSIYSETHKMKPGVNIPDEEAMKRYMKIYNKILRSFYISGCILDENGRGIEGEIILEGDKRGLSYKTKEDGCFSYEISKMPFWSFLFKQILLVYVKVNSDKYEKKMEYKFRFCPGKRLKLKFYPFSNRVEENIEKVK